MSFYECRILRPKKWLKKDQVQPDSHYVCLQWWKQSHWWDGTVQISEHLLIKSLRKLSFFPSASILGCRYCQIFWLLCDGLLWSLPVIRKWWGCGMTVYNLQMVAEINLQGKDCIWTLWTKIVSIFTFALRSWLYQDFILRRRVCHHAAKHPWSSMQTMSGCVAC